MRSATKFRFPKSAETKLPLTDTDIEVTFSIDYGRTDSQWHRTNPLNKLPIFHGHSAFGYVAKQAIADLHVEGITEYLTERVPE